MGRKDDILERVRAIAEPLAAGEGLELVDLELGGSGGGGGTTLRLFIDRIAGAVPGAAALGAVADGTPRAVGVSLDDCANLSHAVSAALDVEDPIAGRYDLEVSSPGLDRPLRTPEHFTRFAGKQVRVKTYGPIAECGGRKTFVGKLIGFADGKVAVNVDGTVFQVPHDQIAKANIEYQFDQ